MYASRAVWRHVPDCHIRVLLRHGKGSGTIDRCPKIRFIIAHAGGALPPLFTRFVKFSAMVPGGRALDAAVVRRQLDEQFYFDLAGFVFGGDEGGVGQLKALVEGWRLGVGD